MFEKDWAKYVPNRRFPRKNLYKMNQGEFLPHPLEKGRQIEISREKFWVPPPPNGALNSPLKWIIDYTQKESATGVEAHIIVFDHGDKAKVQIDTVVVYGENWIVLQLLVELMISILTKYMGIFCYIQFKKSIFCVQKLILWLFRRIPLTIRNVSKKYSKYNNNEFHYVNQILKNIRC